MRLGSNAFGRRIYIPHEKGQGKGAAASRAVFSVVFNAVIVGAEIAVFLPEGFTFKGFLIQAAFVGLGELVVCYAAGMPLCAAINKTGLRKYLK